MSGRERFPHPYEECFVLLPNRCGTSQSTPLRGPTSLMAHCLASTPFWSSASSLAHCPVSVSNTICNGASSPLADIVFFGLSLSGSPLKIFKTRLSRRGFYSLIKNVLFSPTDMGSHLLPSRRGKH